MKKSKVQAPCTIAIVAVNVIVFIVLTMGGMTEDAGYMLEHGAMYVPYVLENGEYYRMFTSIFLHFGFNHLMNNMVILLLLGWSLEAEIGKGKFLLIYFISGFCGNVLSALWDLNAADYAVSAGASGAIFGVIGALLYIAVRNHGRIGNISGKGIVFMVLITLYYGFTSGGVDNFAHIGGLVSGFLLGVLLYWKRNGKRGRDPWVGYDG